MVKIITATYNHSKLLPTLYNSLKNQTNKNFRWIVVNDGGTDNTEDIVKSYISERIVDICYMNKDNGGKSSAINLGLDNVRNEDICVIVDDDEQLFPNAVELIHQYYLKYYNVVGIINFKRTNIKTGKDFSNYSCSDDLMCDFFEFKRQGKISDGYIAYFGYAVANHRFPVICGERYIGPSVLIMDVNSEFKMLWAEVSLGESSYLEDGLTKQARRLRLKNPKGMLVYCSYFQKSNVPLKFRIKYSIAAYAYMKCIPNSKKELRSEGIDTSCFISIFKPLGTILWLRCDVLY